MVFLFIEFNYQLLQAYDFYCLHQRHNVVLQIGGDDQWGNITAGVDLIRRKLGGTTELNAEHQVFGLTFPLITRSDGKKMGKTEKEQSSLTQLLLQFLISSSTGAMLLILMLKNSLSSLPSFLSKKFLKSVPEILTKQKKDLLMK